ncbi:MAG: hypothetical protein ACRD0G_15355 [Acidimicrobiales bacterium]
MSPDFTARDDAIDAPSEGVDDVVGENGSKPKGQVTIPVLPVVLTAIIVALAVFGLIGWERANDAESSRDDLESAIAARQEAEAAAGRFAEAFMTYDYRDVEASQEAVRSLMTGRLAEVYEQGRVQGLAEVFGSLQATSTAEATDVFVTEVSDNRVKAVVAVRLEFTAGGQPEPPQDNILVGATLVRQDNGEWLAEEAGFLVSLGSSAEAGEETPPTTAPPDTSATTAPTDTSATTAPPG